MQSSWCSIPFNEEIVGSLYMSLATTIAYFILPSIIVTYMYIRWLPWLLVEAKNLFSFKGFFWQFIKTKSVTPVRTVTLSGKNLNIQNASISVHLSFNCYLVVNLNCYRSYIKSKKTISRMLGKPINIFFFSQYVFASYNTVISRRKGLAIWRIVKFRCVC